MERLRFDPHYTQAFRALQVASGNESVDRAVAGFEDPCDFGHSHRFLD